MNKQISYNVQNINCIILETKREAIHAKYVEKGFFRKEGWRLFGVSKWLKVSEDRIKEEYRIEGKKAYLKPYIMVYHGRLQTRYDFNTVEDAEETYKNWKKEYDLKEF